MRVYALTGDAMTPMAGVSLALGNFDGVHKGHQAVIASAREAAHRLGAPLAAAIFSPHPKLFFQPDAPPFRLQSDDQRRRALAACGVDILFEIPFDAALATMDDADFVRAILKERIHARHVSVGFDYHYGRARAGDAQKLVRHGEEFGFTVSVTPAVVMDGEKISSTGVRDALTRGEVERAAERLTRPFAIEGVVIAGFQRGRTIDVPTANMSLNAYARPRFGVYAVDADIGDGVMRRGVANCGVKPTVEGAHAPLLETHIFDYSGDLYGRTIEIGFRKFIRDEKKFDGFEALRLQIAQDIEAARTA